MRIGLDFDNTIVDYDHVFHLVAREGGHIPDRLARSKLNVRDHLRASGKHHVWTEMQGYVYGARMSDARPYPGAIEFMVWANKSGHELRIISHKTKYPYLGHKYDLHQSARAWVESVLAAEGRPLIEPRHVFFDQTKDAKIRRIAEQQCDVFVDDLPEILLAPDFPSNVRGILFDPKKHHREQADLISFGSWDDILRHLEAACAKVR